MSPDAERSNGRSGPDPGSTDSKGIAWLSGWRRIALLAAITAAGLLFRLHGIGRESLWTDEGTSVALASLGWGEFFRVLTFERANMGFYMAVLKLWFPFTSGEAGVRLLSVVFAAASIPAIERLGRRLFSPAVGMTAALFLALHGFHVRYSQEARSYTLLVLLVILSTHFLADLVEGSRPRRDGAWYVLLITIAVYSQFMALFMMLAQVASVFVAATAVGKKRCLTAAAVVGALILPLMGVMLVNDLRRTAWIPRLTPERLDNSLRAVSGAEPHLAPWLWLLLLVAVWRAMRSDAPVWLRRALVWLAFPLGLSIAVSFVWPMVVARYLNVLIAPLVLLLAWSAIAVPSRVGRAALVALVCAALLGGTGRAWNASKQDWRHVSEVVMANARPGDAAFFTPPAGYRCFSYYARGSARPLPASLYPDPARHWSMPPIPAAGPLRVRMQPHRRIWLVMGERRVWGTPEGERLREALTSDHRFVRRWKFFDTSVELWASP